MDQVLDIMKEAEDTEEDTEEDLEDEAAHQVVALGITTLLPLRITINHPLRREITPTTRCCNSRNLSMRQQQLPLQPIPHPTYLTDPFHPLYASLAYDAQMRCADGHILLPLLLPNLVLFYPQRRAQAEDDAKIKIALSVIQVLELVRNPFIPRFFIVTHKFAFLFILQV